MIGLAVKAEVKQLALFHHDPEHTDEMMDHVVQAMDRLFAHCNVARRSVAA